MTSSKIFMLSLLGSSLVRTHFLKPSKPLTFPPPLTPSLHFLRHSSTTTTATSAAAVLDTSDFPPPPNSLGHPWPEWVLFVDRLKAKGYFSKNMESDEDGKEEKDLVFYTDANLLKNACLGFARDRFDLFKSLSALDIQTVVEKGCPSIARKVVNSSKRLRAHLRLDEGEVCGSCSLRESCDRSYVILTDNEASARTVDIIRILLLYALDPSVLSKGEISADRIIIETSARRLLSELIELSDTVPAPEITNTPSPLQTTKAPRKKNESRKFDGDDHSQNVEMKLGDWTCSRCNFMNFARNIRCLKCKGDGPKRIDNSMEMKKGDWNCPGCGFMNFASKSSCFRCRGARPPRQLEPGDCNYLNYRRNTSCKNCKCDRPSDGDTLSYEEPRPPGLLEFGEWVCPLCSYVNFRRNTTCRKCSCDRPSSGGSLS
ncbi:hypothetical protein Leryth_011519 [Lithospermum erythrorhizon]|nr:hypothetical protein Leryth_011519 [Lithospermum erythrorhizon]